MAGLEVLYSAVQSQLKGSEDAIICCLHWTIIEHGFKCVGVGDQAPQDVESAKKTELLPSGWNDKQDVYELWYIHTNTKLIYQLKVIKVDEELLVYFMRLSDETVKDMAIKVSEYATADTSNYEKVYKNIDQLQDKFFKAVLEPVIKLNKSETSHTSDTNQQSASNRRNPLIDDDPLRVNPPQRPHASMPSEWADPDDPFSIGRGDLDPLAGGVGGGMMFDPLRQRRPFRGLDPSAGLPGRLPPGAVPPGARFDPFGPGDPRAGRRPGPDPDHLPPPGFDDMFM